MTATAHALLAYAAWTIILVMIVGGYRTLLVMKGEKAANAFSPLGDDVSGFGARATRAHANCYENLAIAATVMLYAIATGQTGLTDPLANIFLGARLLQSITHLLSTSRAAVLVRFGFYIVQILILFYWILRFVGIL